MKVSHNNRLNELAEDHRILLQFFEEMEREETYLDPAKKCLVIEHAIYYVSQHYIREEQTMLHYKYPKREEHIKLHDIIRDKIISYAGSIIHSISVEEYLAIVSELKIEFLYHVEIIDEEFFMWVESYPPSQC